MDTKLITKAEEVGTEYGTNAGASYFDGNTPTDMYVSVLRGIEEGDPLTLDAFPCNPLNGEWADGLAEADVLNEIGYDPPEDDLERYKEESEELITKFDDAYHAAVHNEIERVCREQLKS